MLLLAQVQSLILGTRTEPLSDFEVIELAKLPRGVGVLSVMVQGLKKGVIPVEQILPYLILNANSSYDELLIAAALRSATPNGGRPDPNVYLRPVSQGVESAYGVHALLYVADKFRGQPLAGTLTSLLLAAGARPSLPAFKALSGQLNSAMASQTVTAALAARGVQLPAYVRETASRALPPKRAATLAIILEDESLLPGPADRDQQVIAIQSWSALLPKVARDERYIGENEAGLEHSVKALNDVAFTYLLDLGLTPAYSLLDTVMIMAGSYRDWPLVRRDLQNMIIQAVKRGAKLDTEQAKLYQRVGLDMDLLKNEYSKPYLTKVCSITTGVAPRELRTLAESLGLSQGGTDSSRSTACVRLTRAAQVPTDKLIEAAHTRNTQLFQSRNLHIDEIASGTGPRVGCANLGNGPGIEQRAPRDVVYYRDDADKIWCFGREAFGQMLRDKINPSTSQQLPAYLLLEIEAKSKLWSRGQTVDEAINSMKGDDAISDQDSVHILDLFRKYVIDNKGRDVAKLQPSEIQKLYKDSGYNVEVSSLTAQHALFSLARSAEFMFLHDKPAFEKVMRALR